MPRGAPEHSEGIPAASWKRLGAPPASPGIAGRSPRAARDARRSAREHPGALRGRQNRRQVAPGSAKIDFCPRGSFVKCRRSDFPSIFVHFRFFVKSAKSPKYHACQQNQGFGHSHRESRRSRNVASENDENRFKIEPKSSKIASRALLGALVGRLLPLEATRSSDSVD